jgi:Holliday junction resolvase RusA-like endonuclease
MRLIIENIIIKPYVRMTQRGKFVKKDAQEYLASKEELQLKIKSYMNKHDLDKFPEKTPLTFSMSVHVPTSQGFRADLDNIIKAVADACNDIVYPDDRYINKIDAARWIDNKNYLVLRIDELADDPPPEQDEVEVWDLDKWDTYR